MIVKLTLILQAEENLGIIYAESLSGGSAAKRKHQYLSRPKTSLHFYLNPGIGLQY